MKKDFEHILEEREIKPTAVRILVLRALSDTPFAVSLTDLETQLETIDKSSIFRTLTLFQAHHLIHSIVDGSGQTKYALCPSGCHCGMHDKMGLDDLHIHFSCEKCHRTFCMRGLAVPQAQLPEGFVLTNANYVLIGLCPECSAKNNKK